MMHIYDSNTKLTYLVDTGASFSLIPPQSDDLTPDTVSGLEAANGTPIKTYGEQLLKLTIGLRREFRWPFIVADVSFPILGMDFLRHHELALDPSTQSLIDKTTNYSVKADFQLVKRPIIHAAVMNERYQKILSSFPDLTKEAGDGPNTAHSFRHKIPTTGDPVFCRPRRLNPKMTEIAKEAIQKMLDDGVIRPSNSPYASPLHMVPKKNGWRPVGDYRRLNQQTTRDTYPLPYLQDFSMQLAGKTVFSCIDLKDAFWQIPIAEEDIHKTCITTTFGAYEYLSMNFGLSGAAQSFQRFIDQVTRNLVHTNEDGTTRKVCNFAYVDDLLIASRNLKEHEEDLIALFKRLSEYKLRINVLKCEDCIE